MQIPDAELDVLAALWRHGPLTAMAIRDQLGERRPLSHASVSTLLNRLKEKGLVEYDKSKQGKAFVYRAARPAATRKDLLSEFLDRVFDGCGIELVSTLFRSKLPTDDELNELQQMLNSLRSKKKPRRRK